MADSHWEEKQAELPYLQILLSAGAQQDTVLRRKLFSGFFKYVHHTHSHLCSDDNIQAKNSKVNRNSSLGSYFYLNKTFKEMDNFLLLCLGQTLSGLKSGQQLISCGVGEYIAVCAFYKKLQIRRDEIHISYDPGIVTMTSEKP